MMLAKIQARLRDLQKYGNGISVEFSAGYEFEPHGRASETFEEIWRIHLPTVPSHWMSMTGWRPVKNKTGMTFKGKSPQVPVTLALSFLDFLEENV